jgi:hypothetical protein
MTHYSPVDNGEVHDSPQDEWIDLHDRISQINGVGSPPSTSRQLRHSGDSSPISLESGLEPESPLRPIGPAVDCDQAGHDQEGSYHNNPKTTAAKNKHTNEQPLSFLDRLRNGWLWEVLGLVVCILSFGAIVAVISTYSDKQIPHFSYGITVSG